MRMIACGSVEFQVDRETWGLSARKSRLSVIGKMGVRMVGIGVKPRAPHGGPHTILHVLSNRSKPSLASGWIGVSITRT
jgi:hypothetical protein